MLGEVLEVRVGGIVGMNKSVGNWSGFKKVVVSSKSLFFFFDS